MVPGPAIWATMVAMASCAWRWVRVAASVIRFDTNKPSPYTAAAAANHGSAGESAEIFDETDLSAQRAGAQAPSRLSRPHGDPSRPTHSRAPSRQGAQASFHLSAMPARVGRLRQRSEFLRVASARRKWTTPGLVLQAMSRATPEGPDAAPRVGFTASRKVGNAVARNRARRRLRAVAAATLPLHAALGHDYVIIGRAATLQRPYGALVTDLEAALQRLGAWREGDEALAAVAATAGRAAGQ